MDKKFVDVLVVGAGPAGLAAAIAAKEDGIDNLLVIEREHNPGGILRHFLQRSLILGSGQQPGQFPGFPGVGQLLYSFFVGQQPLEIGWGVVAHMLYPPTLVSFQYMRKR